jgi:hypothetical protein
VAFNPDVAAAPVVPVTVDPAGVGVGWFHVGSGNPDVAIAVPAVVAGVPGPVGVFVWRTRNDFMWPLGGTDTDDDLGLCNACNK